MSKSIGIKLADGGFYPILEEGKAATASMDVTTAKDNQKFVHVDLYRSEGGTMEGAEFIDTLQIDVKPHRNGEPSLHLDISLDEDNVLSAKVTDPESGKKRDVSVPLDTFDPGEAPSGDGQAFDDDTNDTLDLDNLVFDAAEEARTEDNQDFDTADLPDDFFDKSLNDFFDDMPALKSDSENPGIAASNPDIAEDVRLEDYKETKLEDSSFSIDADDLPSSEKPVPQKSDSFTRSGFSFDDELREYGGLSDIPADEGFSTQSALVSDLYDEDNFAEEGHAEASYYEKGKKKSRTGIPLLICLLCAIICVVALLLFLFVIPSRINIRGSDNGRGNAEETPAERPPETKEIPEVDRIIFTDKPITIVPVPAPVQTQPPVPAPPPVSPQTPPDRDTAVPPPPPAPPPPAALQQEQLTPKPIPYKVKWGDTLWDIAWAYYRNPWRYTYIARYNGIKNPDKIVAGTTILIPPRN